MSKAKKSTEPTPADHEGKGFLALAGEAFSVLGEEIVEGKDKVVEVAAAKFADVKKAINKITHKKKAATKRAAGPKKADKKAAVAVKKVAKKAKPAAKKVAKKAKPAAKKAAKKAKAGVKRAVKRAAPKKAAKKKSSGR